MKSKSRRYLFLAVGILGLGYFFYRFRNAITLEGFRWSVVGEVVASRQYSRYCCAGDDSNHLRVLCHSGDALDALLPRNRRNTLLECISSDVDGLCLHFRFGTGR